MASCGQRDVKRNVTVKFIKFVNQIKLKSQNINNNKMLAVGLIMAVIVCTLKNGVDHCNCSNTNNQFLCYRGFVDKTSIILCSKIGRSQ